MRTRRSRALRYAAGIAAFWFVAHAGITLSAGLSDSTSADVAVILGNAVRRDGTPSPRLKARLERGLELYRNGGVRKIIASGGLGVEGYEEADVMARYLSDHGVPASDIFIDRTGANTWSTARATAEIMRKESLHSVIAVSQAFHLARCKLALERAGLTEVGSAHAHFFEVRDIYSMTREFFAYYDYLLFK